MHFDLTNPSHFRTDGGNQPKPGEPIAAVLSHGGRVVAHQDDPSAMPVGVPVIALDVPPWRAVIAEISLRKF